MMRKSLWLKLMGIFSSVIVVGMLATILVINISVSSQFERFVRSGDVAQARDLAGVLAGYYARQGSWEGVAQVLGPGLVSPMFGDMMGGGGMMMGEMMGGMTTAEMIEMMRGGGMGIDRVVLLDARGVVVADTDGTSVGERHPAEHLQRGEPVVVDGLRVGTVLVGSMIEPVLNPLDADFLRSVNLAVLLAAVAAGALALGLGSLLFFQITRPVREVTAAAEALAAGDLSQRAQVHGRDEIGRLALAFNRMADSLARQEELRRNMVSDIAHELRTPLTLMQGTLEAMLDGYYDLSPENVAALHQETLMMIRLVNDLRVLSLAEAGQLTLEVAEVNVGDLVRRVCDSFRPQAEDKGLTLACSAETDLPRVSGDEQRLAQVLSNLLRNALQHTPRQGEIEVHASAVKEGEGTWVRVTVRDTGEGIPAEDLPHVFERFYRADKSRARSSGGSGLGLAIARQLVEAHGGRIWVRSPGLGAGSIFGFDLPV